MTKLALALASLNVALLCASACGGPTNEPTTLSSLDNGPAQDPPGAAGNPSLSAAPGAPYSETVFHDVRITSKPGDPSYHRVRGGVELGGGPFAEVKLVIDLTTTCYPFSNWQAEPPPAGQSWPASCDAFDRNFEVALRDPALPADAPAIELVHAATPFGGPMHVEEDVTDIFNAPGGANGPRVLEVFVPTYADKAGKVTGSAGGWNVTVRFDITKGTAPRDVLAVVPLQYGPITEGGVAKTYPFTLPPGTTRTRIDYTASGHGSGTDASCIGQAEEFCRRKHTLTLDGATLATIDPWRSDCGTLCTMTPGGPGGRSYCKENPCGAPASVRAPRANWCPGSVTRPRSFEPELVPGDHVLALTVDRIAVKGNWRIGARVIAYR